MRLAIALYICEGIVCSGRISWQEIQTNEMNDIASQRGIIAKGWRGFKMEEQEGKQLVFYGSKHTC